MAVSKRLRFEVLRRDNHTCRYCGGSAPDVALTVDHVVPTTLGGNDDPSNLVAACKDCNAGKSSIAPDAVVVDDVAADALRWAHAMRLAADEQQLERRRQVAFAEGFAMEWNTWTDWRGSTFNLPAALAENLQQFLTAGLDGPELSELINVAMQARSRDPWRYFCGCCWTRIRERQARATEILKAEEAAITNG